MENSLSLYSVNRNKESFGDVDMGRLMVRGEGKAKAFHGILNQEAGSESVAVPIFLLEMEDLYIICQCGDLYYLLTHILRGAGFFFVLISAAIFKTTFLPVLHYRFKKTAYGNISGLFFKKRTTLLTGVFEFFKKKKKGKNMYVQCKD